MSQRDRTVLMVVVALAVAAATWFVAVKPKRQEAADLQVKVEQTQAAADQSASAAAAAADARRNYGREYATVVRLGRAVPADDGVASLMYQLDRTAEQSGVDFSSVSVSGDSGAEAAPTPGADGSAGALAGGVTPIPLTMTFTGSYAQMTRFLQRIQRYTTARGDVIDVRGRLISIDSIDVTPVGEDLSDVKADVSATAYRAPLSDPQAGGGAVPDPAATGQPAAATPPPPGDATASSKRSGPPSAVIGG